jgi:hypothetical protein
MPRGSSAIFDACGCVLAVNGEQNAPKQIRQTKQPAEAEGKGIEPFFLLIEDVALEGRPTAGVRIVTQEPAQATPQTGASAKFLALKETIFQLVATTPGLRSKNSICDRVTGGNKSAKYTAIDELVQEGRLTYSDSGFITSSAEPKTVARAILPVPPSVPSVPSGPEPVPSRSRELQQFPGTGPAVPVVNTGTAGPGLPPPPPGLPPPPRRTDRDEERKRSEAQDDADVIATMPTKERVPYMAAQGWSEGRSKRARGALALREASIRRDALELQKAVDGGLDVAAWATERGWSDARIAAAKLRMEI